MEIYIQKTWKRCFFQDLKRLVAILSIETLSIKQEIKKKKQKRGFSPSICTIMKLKCIYAKEENQQTIFESF